MVAGYFWLDNSAWAQGSRPIHIWPVRALSVFSSHRHSVGPNDIINGIYRLLPHLHDGKSCYRHDEEGLFVYFLAAHPGWFIGTAVGDLNTPAYVNSSAHQPFDVTVRRVPRLPCLVHVSPLLSARVSLARCYDEF